MLLYPAMNQQPSVSLGWGIKKTFESIYPKIHCQHFHHHETVLFPQIGAKFIALLKLDVHQLDKFVMFTVFDPNTSSHFIFFFDASLGRKPRQFLFPSVVFYIKLRVPRPRWIMD